VEQERMGLDHKERYYISYCDIDKGWDIYRDQGMFFPTHIVSCFTQADAKLVRDALESFPHEIEDYL
jgi:hypothetical protein